MREREVHTKFNSENLGALGVVGGGQH